MCVFGCVCETWRSRDAIRRQGSSNILNLHRNPDPTPAPGRPRQRPQPLGPHPHTDTQPRHKIDDVRSSGSMDLRRSEGRRRRASMGSSSRPSFASRVTSFVGAAASAILLAVLAWVGMELGCLLVWCVGCMRVVSCGCAWGLGGRGRRGGGRAGFSACIDSDSRRRQDRESLLGSQQQEASESASRLRLGSRSVCVGGWGFGLGRGCEWFGGSAGRHVPNKTQVTKAKNAFLPSSSASSVSGACGWSPSFRVESSCVRRSNNQGNSHCLTSRERKQIAVQRVCRVAQGTGGDF